MASSVSLDHEVLEVADAGGRRWSNPSWRVKMPWIGALDLEVEGLAVAGHEIDGLSVVIEKDRADRLRDVHQQVGEQVVERHQGLTEKQLAPRRPAVTRDRKR